MPKIYISWSDFHQDAKELFARLKTQRKFNKIIAISRGGLLPAGIAAYEMDIRDCDIINIASYDRDKMRADDKIEISSMPADIDENTLVIDDLADSGRTLQLLRRRFPLAVYAVVYAKPRGKTAVDAFAKELPGQWVVFPWD